MPLSSRFIFSSLKSRRSEAFLQIFRRFSVSKRVPLSILSGSSASNVSIHPLLEQRIRENPVCLARFRKETSSCKSRFKCGFKIGNGSELDVIFEAFEPQNSRNEIFVSSSRHYSSDTRSSNNNKKPPFPLPNQTVPLVSWKAFLFPGSVLAGVGGLFLLMHYNDERRAVPKGKGEKFERSAIQGPIIGGPFSLIDTEGRHVTEKNLVGNWVLLYFGYTSSPDVGPSEVQKMAKAIHILESKQNIKILPIFVTIDPQRDSPSQLRAYLEEFDSRIVGLTGPVFATRQMAQEYRVFFKKVDEAGDDYLVESSHNMYLMNPNMEVARSFGVEYNAEELAEAITKEMMKTKTIV